MLPHKLPSFNESFASLDSDSNVRTTLFSPTADIVTMGFHGSAGAKGTARDRERTSTPTPMLGVQQPVFQPVTRQSSFSNEGRITPTFDDGAKKVTGREKGAMSYSAEEHVYLLSGMKTITDSFNASESSPEWKSLYKLMVEQYYKTYGYNVRPSSKLQSHFVDMYSAFKNGIRGLSVVVGAPKCPIKFDNDAGEVEDFVNALEAHLTTKKGSPKKWWSTEVIKLLLELHIDYSKDFGIGSQGVAFLEEKKADQKSKYERDQKNREDMLAKKRALEEEERLEAAKNRKIVAEQSIRMADCFEKIANNATTSTDISKVVDEKLEAHQARVVTSVQNMLGNFLNEVKVAICQRD
jgi:hypothetical protein